MPETFNLTKQDLQDILKTAISAAVAEATKMNPIEQKKYDEEMAKEERKKKMMIALGKAEEEAQASKKNSCSHCRWPATAGKRAGHPAPRGEGEWCTGAHIHSDDTITLICVRCSTVWRWKGTSAERQYINDADGGNGMAPPPEERLLKLA